MRGRLWQHKRGGEIRKDVLQSVLQSALQSALHMAYALGLPWEVTRQVESFRDWRLEDVKRNGGTPSRLALLPFDILRPTGPQPAADYRDTYYIRVQKKCWTDPGHVMSRTDGVIERMAGNCWGETLSNGNGHVFAFDGVGSLVMRPVYQGVSPDTSESEAE